MANPCVTRKTADPSPSEKGIKSFNSNYTDNYTEEFPDTVKQILIVKSDIADRSSFGSMAEATDNRVKADATREDVQQMCQGVGQLFKSKIYPNIEVRLPLPATPPNPMIAGKPVFAGHPIL